MKDLIVCDFDHILINDEEEIPTSTIILIDELRRDDKKLIINTDTNLNRLLYYNYSLPFIDYIISSSGAIVYDCVSEKIVYKKSILFSNVNKIVKSFYDKYPIYLTDDSNYNLINFNSLSDDDVNIIENYNEYLINNKNNIYKIDIHIDDKTSVKECISILNDLNLKTNIIINENDSSCTISIVHEDVSSFKALEKAIYKCKKKISDVIYIGTDIDILQSVEVGVTTEEEVPYIRKISTDITNDCNHKGVENFLKKYYEKVM